jgi:DNA-binding NarL/FixJ family response regulator
METPKKVHITIVAGNPLFSEMLRKSMETMVEEKVEIHSLDNNESFLEELLDTDLKPDIVVLDFGLNKVCKDEDVCVKTLEKIKKITPDTSVIVMASEEEMNQGAKMLRYGANEFVVKDKFVFSHIANAVKSCLNPSHL